MNATTDAIERPIDRWFASYAQDHQHPVNRLIHWISRLTGCWWSCA